MDKPIALFIYGTLKEAYIQRGLIGRELEGVPDRLANHRKVQVVLDGDTYPDIEQAPGERVEGLRVGVDEQELRTLDAYEGLEYSRTKVVLESGAAAWVYSTQIPRQSFCPISRKES